MNRSITLLGAAAAPAIWGSTYLVTTEALPQGFPLTTGLLRALPAGLVLLALVRCLPPRRWLVRLLVLGSLNFALFWSLLFVAAYRLPGGVAATLGATQPLMVLLLARLMLDEPLRLASALFAALGMAGVALLLVEPAMTLDIWGVAAALGGAGSMAAGSVLTRRWRPPVTPLVFTAWQLTAGGVILLPIALLFEPDFPQLTWRNLAGYGWLGVVGAALTYYLWFRGIERFGPATVTMFGFLSPLSAVLLGWLLLGQQLSLMQWLSVGLILFSVLSGQLKSRCSARRVATTGDEVK